MLNKIVKTKDRVEELLTRYPILRDDDNKLMARIWKEESLSHTAKDLLIEIGNGKLTSAEAITRARRKLQEQNPGLRGKAYALRHKHEVTVRNNINFI